MRVLGVDYGNRKVGLAIGDTQIHVATPLEVWVHEGSIEHMAKRVSAFAVQEHVETIVVGVPYQHRETQSEQVRTNQAFIEALEMCGTIPVVAVNESLTSKASQVLQQEAGTVAGEDALAAMLILQEYFEHAHTYASNKTNQRDRFKED